MSLQTPMSIHLSVSCLAINCHYIFQPKKIVWENLTLRQPSVYRVKQKKRKPKSVHTALCRSLFGAYQTYKLIALTSYKN